MGGTGSRYSALAAGAVDATILTLPFNLDAGKAGFKNLLWLGEKLEMPLTGRAVRDETIQRKPRQIFSILRAMLRAIGYGKGHSEESSQILVDFYVDRPGSGSEKF